MSKTDSGPGPESTQDLFEPINSEARALCAKWQKRLRLQDWRIKVDVVRHYRMPDTVCESGTEAAHMVKHRHDQSAEIWVCHPDDLYPDSFSNVSLEQSIVHELLHIQLDAWEPEPETPAYWAMERAINIISDALIVQETNELPNA